MTILFYLSLFVAIGGSPGVVAAIITPTRSLGAGHGSLWAAAIVLAIVLRHHA